MMTKQEEIKQLLGKKAAELVEDGMLVGLGTGTTAAHFIESLINRCKEGLKITSVSSSLRSLIMAKNGGIPVVDMAGIIEIDLTVDGADEVDPYFRMIKGGGGAHVREKILASASKRVIIIVDESKLVQQLGKRGVPVEILPFGAAATMLKLSRLGYNGDLRKNKENTEFFVTENGNYIYDIHFPHHFPDPEQDHDFLVNVPGVVDTGFFFNLPVEVYVGHYDGKIHKLRSK